MKAYQKLKQNWEFHRAYNRGVSCISPAFVLYVVKGKKGVVRLGITVGKKLGCAVKRNRAKRLITAAFDSLVSHLPMGYDYVIVARTRIISQKSTQVADALEKQLKDKSLWID